MKKLIIIFLLFAGTVSAQTMLVSSTEEKYDEVLDVSKNNIQSLSNFWVDKILEKMPSDSVYANHIITLKKDVWDAVAKFEKATKIIVEKETEVDSLKTMQIVQRNDAEIKVLKKKMSSCKDCDTEVLQKMVDMLQKQKDEAVKHSNNWVKKPEPKKEIINANTDR